MSNSFPRLGKPAPLFEGDVVRFDSRKKQIFFDTISLNKIIEEKKWSVLFFYPRDFSSLCPTEIHSFNRRIKDFEKANAAPLGDSEARQVGDWAIALGWCITATSLIPIPLLAVYNIYKAKADTFWNVSI